MVLKEQIVSFVKNNFCVFPPIHFRPSDKPFHGEAIDFAPWLRNARCGGLQVGTFVFIWLLI